jgi:hypothetical protein
MQCAGFGQGLAEQGQITAKNTHPASHQQEAFQIARFFQ